MSLTVKELEHAKPREKEYKLYDEHGLSVVVSPSGGKWFRFKYTRPTGKENRLSLGVFPGVTLAEAREKRDEMRKLLSQGIDPSHDGKEKKLAVAEAVANDFKSVAQKYIAKRKYAKKNLRTVEGRLENYVFPKIGSLPISKITPPQVLAVVDPIDDGASMTLHIVFLAYAAKYSALRSREGFALQILLMALAGL